ncbi:replication associated protein [Felismacovirus babas1]|uniref:Replication associated protein n=1 Tax=Papio kindae associated smacovirus TaxID=2213169 RepID=A0A455R4M1_9VIRU|nr:replication associated protein [Papio kindae associated smacovirus]
MARCKWIDATVWVDGDAGFAGVVNEDEWRKEFAGLFDRYAYGREVAPSTGRRHFQFRGVLKSDCDAGTLGVLTSLGFRDISPTHVRDFEYVYKDADFYCSWELFRPEFADIRDHPYDYQVQLKALPRDDRSIEIVVDSRGNWGKTAFSMYMEYLHKGVYIPPLKRGLDVSACVLGKRISEWYLVDTPRSFEFDADWACALEQLKNGYVYDTRYSFRDKVLPVRPRVTVLCNREPEYDMFFSKDRVQLFEITDKGYLWPM